MSYSNAYTNVKNMFWDGGGFKLDRVGIEESLRRALHDYTSRTQAKQAENNNASIINMYNALDPCFVNEFQNYFNNPVKTLSEYDEWHHRMCDLFIKSIEAAKIKNPETYGKAQKIVNMTMKTIFCLNGADVYDEQGYFKYCHMPLDSINSIAK